VGIAGGSGSFLNPIPAIFLSFLIGRRYFALNMGDSPHALITGCIIISEIFILAEKNPKRFNGVVGGYPYSITPINLEDLVYPYFSEYPFLIFSTINTFESKAERGV
jgi:hypothetical protein